MSDKTSTLKHCIEIVRHQDPDAMTMLSLLDAHALSKIAPIAALNCEIAAIPSAVKEQALGEIRYQWWREGIESILEGQEQAHPVLEALLVADNTPSVYAALRRDIDAREALFIEDMENMSLSRALGYAEARGKGLYCAYSVILSDTKQPATSAQLLGEVITLSYLAQGIGIEASDNTNARISKMVSELSTAAKSKATEFNGQATATRMPLRPLVAMAALALTRARRNPPTFFQRSILPFVAVLRAKI